MLKALQTLLYKVRLRINDLKQKRIKAHISQLIVEHEFITQALRDRADELKRLQDQAAGITNTPSDEHALVAEMPEMPGHRPAPTPRAPRSLSDSWWY